MLETLVLINEMYRIKSRNILTQDCIALVSHSNQGGVLNTLNTVYNSIPLLGLGTIAQNSI